MSVYSCSIDQITCDTNVKSERALSFSLHPPSPFPWSSFFFSADSWLASAKQVDFADMKTMQVLSVMQSREHLIWAQGWSWKASGNNNSWSQRLPIAHNPKQTNPDLNLTWLTHRKYFMFLFFVVLTAVKRKLSLRICDCWLHFVSKAQYLISSTAQC